MKYEQLSFFNGEEKAQPKESVSQNSNFSEVQISYKVRNSFSITELPFLGCDFDSVYPALANIIPKEYIVFSDFPLNVAISCEIICAAICHQMNWDYLRNTIFMKVTENNACNGVQREHNKKLNNGLPILHKVPPKRDYGRYFCIMAEKGGTSHGGLTEKLSLFFHAKKQEVNAYGR